MGQPQRAKNIVQNICLSDEQIDALNKNDEARWFTIAMYTGLDKCGNCPKRMKCATDIIGQVRQSLNIPIPEDTSSSKIAETGIKIYEYLDQRLDESEKSDIIKMIKSGLGVNVETLLKILDHTFEECDEYD